MEVAEHLLESRNTAACAWRMRQFRSVCDGSAGEKRHGLLATDRSSVASVMIAFPPGLSFWLHPQNLHIYSAVQTQSRQRRKRHRLVNRCGSISRLAGQRISPQGQGPRRPILALWRQGWYVRRRNISVEREVNCGLARYPSRNGDLGADSQESPLLYPDAGHASCQAERGNQDDVSAYHLFYADAHGTPGTDLTFFDWPIPRQSAGALGDHTHPPARLRARDAGMVGATSARACGNTWRY